MKKFTNFKIRFFKKVFLISSLLLSFITPNLSAYTITTSISSSNDDAEQRVSNGNMSLVSSDLEIVFDGSNEQIIGMRFNNVLLPSNATVSNAYIQFTVDETDNGTTNVTVYGESNVNPVDFNSQNISTRAATASSINWTIPAWTTVGDATSNQQTPDLTNILNDIIALASWESSKSMVFMIKAGASCSSSSCQRTAESYNGTSSSAPKLIIEYTLPTTFYAYNDFTNAMPDSSIVIDVLANDIAGVGETLVNNSVAIVTAPANGTYSINTTTGSITYSPNSGFSGTDTFTYTVQNSSSATSNTAKVTVDVGYIVGDRDFTVRNPSNTRNIRGNYKIGGNINLCTYDKDTGNDPTSTGNAKPWSGECIQTYSNSYPSSFLDIDGNSSTVNSSSFELDLPTNSEVVWAGLYWQGVVHNSDINEDFMDYQTISGAPQISGNKGLDLTNNTYGADKVKFQIPGGNYVEVTAQQLDFSDLGYAGFLDVTSMLNATSPNGVYIVADIKSHQGTETNHGNYAGWSLVVIYENSSEDFRNITLFDGFVTVTSSYNSDLVIDGFLTPKTTPINSTLSFFTMDGDNGSNSLHIVNESGVSTEVVNSIASHSLFDASIQGVYNRNPLVPSARMDLNSIDLVNVLGPLNTTAILQPRSGGDRYTASFFIMSSDLYAPKLCYDYAYSQYGQFFTEDYNATSSPSLKGNIINGEPVEIKFYIKNTENSDFIADNLKVNILDLNISQATYKDDSTYVTYPNSIIKTLQIDSSLTIAADKSSVEDINIGVVDSLEYFYTYLSLNTTTSTLDMPLNVRINYDLKSSAASNLTLNIPYDAYLKDMDICTGSSEYNPGKGIFNIVHDNYVNGTLSSGYYYNLPTQVVSREGNFKVISMDPDDLDARKGTSTMVGVEMIDVSAFHDTNASCQEQASSISDIIWVTFDNNTSITNFDKDAIQAAISPNNNISSSSEFYKNSRQNTAFRISYNVTSDGNESLIQHTWDSSNDTYKILNFSQLVQNIGTCAQTVQYPTGNHTTPTIQVSNACGNSGNFLSRAHYQACQECLYGINTKMVCSRDNFSIRPEAFMLHINDQNQTNTTSQSRLTTNYSGIVGATAPVINMASSYDYNIEINATNHVDNNASSGYIQFFDSSPSNTAKYIWEPRSSITTNACNDEDNKTVPIIFMNGLVDTTNSVNQVGEYRLNILDTIWTTVDSNPTHHAGNYFLPSSTADCAINDSTTQNTNSSALNGCNISSQHINNDNNFVYNDYDVTFHPYEFTITTAISLGLNKISPPALKPFVYMADIALDENMSVDISSSITARGKNSATALSNFVTGCFAQPLDINISKSATLSTQLEYKFALLDINSTGSRIVANDINGSIPKGNTLTSPSFTTTSSHFQKNMNGRLTTTALLNFNREINASANPENITFGIFSVRDPNIVNNFNADLLTLQNADSNVTLNQSVIHYYARTAGKRRVSIVCDATAPCLSAGTEPDVFIYYEIFCNGTINGNTCNSGSSLLPTVPGFQDAQSVHLHWWTSFDHNTTSFGALSETNSTDGSVSRSGVLNPDGLNYRLNPVHSYDLSNGLPYTATMQDTVPRWLIYNETNATAIQNTHSVEFRAKSTWSGEHETNTTTKTKFIRRVNRRTMW